MIVTKTNLPEVLILTPQLHCDSRGYFFESWNRQALSDLAIGLDFVQENQSRSIACGTLRGLHFQAPPYAQDKLVRCISGSVLDVAVDIRAGSPNFGRWVGVELSAKNARQILIPQGFLHGFVTTSPNTEILYKCTDRYVPESEGIVKFSDPDLAIDWGIEPDAVLLSEKDRTAPAFCDFQSPFVYSTSAKIG